MRYLRLAAAVASISVICAAALLGSGCASSSWQHEAQQRQGTAGLPEPAPGSLAGLPPLGRLDALGSTVAAPRETSALQTNLGNEIWDSGGTAAFPGTSAQLTPAVGELSWAMYAFNGSAGQTASGLSVTAAGSYWVAVSNYGAGRWDIFGPFTGNAAPVIGAAGEQFSTGMRLFVAVLAWDASATVESVSLDVT